MQDYAMNAMQKKQGLIWGGKKKEKSELMDGQSISMTYERISSRKYREIEKSYKCVQCGQTFSFVSNGIGIRRYCSDFCRRNSRNKAAKSRPLCVNDGCKNSREYSSGLCNSCYYRLKRTGTIEKRKYVYRCLASNGYITVWDKEHPLSVGGRLYEHRKVLYDKIGEGIHECYWCKSKVAWAKGRNTKGCLVVDHLDGDKENNSLDNLVPACHRCNASRGMFQHWINKHQDDPWLWKLYNMFLEKKQRVA